MPQAPHKPTAETRKVAHTLAGYGIKQEIICKALGISLPTLHKHYRDELDKGDAQGQGKIGEALFQKAMKGDTAALIFLAKVRLDFKETSRHEHTGADGGPIRTSEDSPRERVERRLAGLKVVGGTDADSSAA